MSSPAHQEELSNTERSNSQSRYQADTEPEPETIHIATLIDPRITMDPSTVTRQPSRSISLPAPPHQMAKQYTNEQMLQLSLCLPGLEPLIETEQLFLHQAVKFSELFSNVPNDFEVLTSSGQRLFRIIEATGQVARDMGGGHQNFELNFCDADGKRILFIQGHPGFYGGRACVSIHYGGRGSDQKMGEVVQVKSGCSLEYVVKDPFGNPMLKIAGPPLGDCCCGVFMLGSVAFPVVSLDGKSIVGGIGKLWGGVAREFFTMADNYGIQYPSDLDTTTKCLLLSAAIMLDFQFFERQ